MGSYTTVQHIGHPDCPSGFNTIYKFGGTTTEKDIISYIKSVRELDPSKTHKHLVEIGELHHFVLLNDDYLEIIKPFGCDGPQNAPVNLRVTWACKNDAFSVSTKPLSNNSITTDNVNNAYDENQASVGQNVEDSHHASYSSTKNAGLIQRSEHIHFNGQMNHPTDPIKEIENELRSSLDRFSDMTGNSGTTQKQQQTPTEDDDLGFFLSQPINNPSQNEYNPTVDINQLPENTDSIIPFDVVQITYSESAQGDGSSSFWNDLSPQQRTTSNNACELPTNTALSVDNIHNDHRQEPANLTLKRKRSLEEIALAGTRFIYYLPDLGPSIKDMPYDPSTMPSVNEFIRDKMLWFKRNLEKYHHRLQYLKNGTVANLQGVKTKDDNVKDSTPIILTIPMGDKNMIDGGALVILCLTCVRECDTDQGEKELSMVGNKIFLEAANTPHATQVEHVFIVLTKENTTNSEYIIRTALIKKIHLEKDAEIGRVLFKLSREYVEAAKLNGIEFYKAKPMHRLAVFILRFISQANMFVPDLNTLCLSNYIHQTQGK